MHNGDVTAALTDKTLSNVLIVTSVILFLYILHYMYHAYHPDGIFNDRDVRFHAEQVRFA